MERRKKESNFLLIKHRKTCGNKCIEDIKPIIQNLLLIVAIIFFIFLFDYLLLPSFFLFCLTLLLFSGFSVNKGNLAMVNT